jgi:hypothetical protein
MCIKKVIASFLIFGLCSFALAEKQAKVKPITAVSLESSHGTFTKILKKAGSKTPLVLDTEEAAKKYFAEKELKALKKKMNFATQKLIVIVWRGSGGDKISYTVMESFPEQVIFNYKRGMTRNLGPHFKLFALRKNVKIKEGCMGLVSKLTGNHMPGPTRGVSSKGKPLSVAVYIFKGRVKVFNNPDPKHKQLLKSVQSGKDGKFKLVLEPGVYTAVAVINGKMYLNSFIDGGTWSTFTVTKGKYTNVNIQDTSQAVF